MLGEPRPISGSCRRPTAGSGSSAPAQAGDKAFSPPATSIWMRPWTATARWSSVRHRRGSRCRSPTWSTSCRTYGHRQPDVRTVRSRRRRTHRLRAAAPGRGPGRTGRRASRAHSTVSPACGRGDSNPHARRHGDLSAAWLPGYTTPACGAHRRHRPVPPSRNDRLRRSRPGAGQVSRRGDSFGTAPAYSVDAEVAAELGNVAGRFHAVHRSLDRALLVDDEGRPDDADHRLAVELLLAPRAVGLEHLAGRVA